MWSLGGDAGVSDDYEFVNKFTKHDYELHFLIPKGEPGSQPDIENFHTHTYPNFFKAISNLPTFLRRLLLPFLFNSVVIPRALLLARALKPDFVLGHSHYSTAATFMLRKLRSLPTGVKLFGVMDLVHTQWPRWKYLYKNAEQMLALKFPQDLWIVLDDGTKGREALLRHGVSNEKIHFLPNGINLEWADHACNREKIRKEMRIPRDACVVLFLSRFVPSKRPEAVIRSIPRVLELAEREAIFLFVGGGPLKASSVALAARSKVAEHTRFMGPVPHSRVPDVFCASDIFISTSNLTNMAIPTFEAFVCGVPVVAFDVGDTKKAVKENETGCTVPDGDIEALARAITDLANNEEKRAALGLNAKKYAMENFTSWDERTDKELEIIDSWVRASRATS
ncbi:MAG: glycosyltransferase [Candidatus Latescibacteria bacterium]|nr:glycosyltransferase [Candidatus Latescibacterota bacterium]NIM21974.1 glycosyltransferase [Candidatus Latescibacterota bacterium]NIM65992.1 glycosyltransferase [Candidatus Latescibacterota bacterium]NIO02400.1 glycosyltransferase [Candidatus Latescibacterota bacterium]NIO29310.1 glycosyltransferase [Candidatus Latescibacterota bacterium]